jgi:hypothetical protein
MNSIPDQNSKLYHLIKKSGMSLPSQIYLTDVFWQDFEFSSGMLLLQNILIGAVVFT